MNSHILISPLFVFFKDILLGRVIIDLIKSEKRHDISEESIATMMHDSSKFQEFAITPHALEAVNC